LPASRLDTLDIPPAPGAPPKIQVRRVLLLARLMTAMTATFGTVLYLVIEAFERIGGQDIPLDQYLLNGWLWAAIFAFWTMVMACMRRPLRLHL
jgi:hypothetical protein